MRMGVKEEPRPLPRQLWWASRVWIPLCLALVLAVRLASMVDWVQVPGPWWLLSMVSPLLLAWLWWQVRRERGFGAAWQAMRASVRQGMIYLLAMIAVLFVLLGS